MQLRPLQYLGYAAGDVSNNLTFSMVSAFLLIYYTDVVGMPAATAGTLFLLVRIWGGFTDLIAGRRVDGTRRRWGRFRPYLLFGSVPLMLTLVALFSVPGGLGAARQADLGVVTYALFSLAYSFVNIPYGSLAAAMTQESGERAKLSTARMVAASLTILVIALVVSPQISGAGDLQRSLTITTVIFAVVGLVFYLWCFATARETVQRGVERVSVRETLGMMRHNRPLVLLCVSSLLFLTGMFSLQTVGVYYARDVLGNADLYIVLTIVQTVGHDRGRGRGAESGRRGREEAGVRGGRGDRRPRRRRSGPLPRFPAGGGHHRVRGAGRRDGIINTLIFALQADTVEYGEWKSGVRAEGGSYAVLSFTRKAGQGVGGALAAFTIGLGGYVAGAATQNPAAETSIRIAAGGLPAAAFLAATAVMLAYPLTEKAFRRLIADLAERRATAPIGP